MPRFYMNRVVDEATSCFLKITTMLDEEDVAIPGSAVNSATLTLTDKETGVVINGRSATNVLNTGPGTWGTDGAVEIRLDPADNDIVGSSDIEVHVARMDYTYNTSVVGMVEWEFTVRRF